MTAMRSRAAERLGRAGLAPRGLSREEAAAYIGIGATHFDKLVADGRMPAPRRLGSRAIWDRHDVDEAFERLPRDDGHAGTSGDDIWDRVA